MTGWEAAHPPATEKCWSSYTRDYWEHKILTRSEMLVLPSSIRTLQPSVQTNGLFSLNQFLVMMLTRYENEESAHGFYPSSKTLLINVMPGQPSCAVPRYCLVSVWPTWASSTSLRPELQLVQYSLQACVTVCKAVSNQDNDTIVYLLLRSWRDKPERTKPL